MGQSRYHEFRIVKSITDPLLAQLGFLFNAEGFFRRIRLFHTTYPDFQVQRSLTLQAFFEKYLIVFSQFKNRDFRQTAESNRVNPRDPTADMHKGRGLIEDTRCEPTPVLARRDDGTDPRESDLPPMGMATEQ